MPGNDIAEKFSGLPIGQLICGPLVEVAKGQAELCKVYLDYVCKLAWKDGKPNGDANIVSFTLNRPITDNKGNISTQKIQVNAPLLSLVPIPAFTMEEATVSFTMEVKEQSVDTSSSSSTASASGSFSFWGFSASFSGSVTTSSGNTRESDQSAKYEITARATQQPPAEGMARLSQIFASVITPLPVGSGT